MSCWRSSSMASATVWSQLDGDHRRRFAGALGHDRAHAGRLREAGEEPVLAHPVVAVDLREVAAAAVRQEHDDQRLRVVHLARHLERGVGGQPAGAADEDPFLAGDASRGEEGILVGDFHPRVDQRRVEGARPEVLADALHLVGVHGVGLGVDASLGVGADDLDRRVVLLEVLRHAGDRAAGADAGHEVGHPPAALLPDLGAGRLVVGARDSSG